MNLSEANIHQKVTIKTINCDEELKKRFYSFGIMKNSIVTIEDISFAKNTIGLNIDGTLVALRMEEAKTIEVILETKEEKI